MPHLGDTDAEPLRVMTALYRRMSPHEKLERVRQLTLAASLLSLRGLASRYPSESDIQLLRRLARLRLGEAMAGRAYPEPER